MPTPSTHFVSFFIFNYPLCSVPLCPNVLPPQSPINHPQLIHSNPQLSLPSANYVTTKYVPINISASHPSLSLTETSIASQPSPAPVRNYAKILPKSNANLVKLSAPIPFHPMPNHYLIPTTVSISSLSAFLFGTRFMLIDSN